MKMSHTWNDGERDMGWAVPSQREIAASRKANDEANVLAYCEPPRGWVDAGQDDTTDDGGNPGRYVVRA